MFFIIIIMYNLEFSNNELSAIKHPLKCLAIKKFRYVFIFVQFFINILGTEKKNVQNTSWHKMYIEIRHSKNFFPFIICIR